MGANRFSTDGQLGTHIGLTMEELRDQAGIEIVSGAVTGQAVVHKFGFGTVGTSFVPVSNELVYQTPTTATALEFLSSDTNDTSAGSGAREVTVVGLDANWAEVTQTVVTNGTTPVALGTSLIRLYRWYVSSSGTYATAAAGSHAGELKIRVASAGADWSTIPFSPFPTGQSLIGAYTVPTGKTGYILSQHIHVDSTKSVDLLFFKRNNADDVATPYSGAMRVLNQFIGISGDADFHPETPINGLVGPCDVGFMAKVTSNTADVSVDFEILLIDD